METRSRSIASSNGTVNIHMVPRINRSSDRNCTSLQDSLGKPRRPAKVWESLATKRKLQEFSAAALESLCEPVKFGANIT